MQAKAGDNTFTPCQVFWDIENVPLLKGMRPREFIELIRNSVLKPNKLTAEEFFCVCDTVKMHDNNFPQDFFDVLNRAGVTIVHICSNSKNAADEKIIDLMCKYVDKGGPAIVLIAGDVNYVNHLRRFQTKNTSTYLICHSHQSCSRDLVNCAQKSYIFEKSSSGGNIIRPFASRDTAIITPTRRGVSYVKVFGFPDRLEKKPLVAFKQLLSACGGRIRSNINEIGYIWVEFKCPEDAHRAAKKMDGWRFGNNNLLHAKYVEKPNFGRDQFYSPPSYGGPPATITRPISCGSIEATAQIASPSKLASHPIPSDPYVEVFFENFDPDVIKQFLLQILPIYKGSMIRSESSRFLIKFSSRDFVDKFISEVNSLNKRSARARIEAKVVPFFAENPNRNRNIRQSPQRKVEEIKIDDDDVPSGISCEDQPTDDDIVYLCTTTKRTTYDSHNSDKLYLSILFKPREKISASRRSLVTQLEGLGISIVYENETSMWFKVRDKEHGHRVMEKFNKYGYTSYLVDQLPDDLQSKLNGVKAWRLKSCEDSKFQTKEQHQSGSKTNEEDELNFMIVDGLSGKMTTFQVWSALQDFVEPYQGKLIIFDSGQAYINFPSSNLLQQAFKNMQGNLVDGLSVSMRSKLPKRFQKLFS